MYYCEHKPCKDKQRGGLGTRLHAAGASLSGCYSDSKFCTALYEECNAFHSIPLYFIHNILLLGVNAVVVQSKLPIKLVKVHVLSL